MKIYKCLLCGKEFEFEEDEELICPFCGAEGEDLELVEAK